MDTSYKYKFFMIGFIVMLMVNIGIIGSIWYLKPPRDFNDDRRQRSSQPFERELGLSKEQMDTFKNIRDDYRKEVSGVYQNIQRSKNELYLQLQTGNEQNIDSLVVVIGKNYEKLERMNFDHFQELSSNLEPGQREAFRKVMRMMVNPQNRRMGGGSPPPMGRRDN